MKRRDFLTSLGALVGGFAARGVATAAEAIAPDSTATPPPAPPGATPTPTASPVTPAPPANSAGRAGDAEITLAVGGDTTLGYNLEAHFDRQLEAGVAKDALWPLYFAGIQHVMDAADVAMVNLECPFTERGVKVPKNFNFRARPELVRVLQEGSVDVVSLANNHTADWGRRGVRDTMDTLDGAGIAHFGAGMRRSEARKPAILERRGMRIGFVGFYFQAPPDMLEPEVLYATAGRAGVSGCYQDLDCIRAQVDEDVRDLVSRVDFAIPYFHWGKEGSYEVRDYQIELAHRCIDLGCAAVFGAHPHRLQAVEVYRQRPIFYSLGNFVYGGIKEPSDTLSMIAKVGLSRSGVTAEVVPVQFTDWLTRPFQPWVLEGEAGVAAMNRIAGLPRAFATLPQIAASEGARTLAPAAAPAPPAAPAETSRTSP